MNIFKKNISDIYMKVYNNCSELYSEKIFRALMLSRQDYFLDPLMYCQELEAALFVVVDFAISNSNYRIYREKVAQSIIIKNPVNQERVNFYGSVVRGRKLVAECLMYEDVSSLPFPNRVAIAISDILLNSQLKADYDSSPIVVGNIFDTVSTYELIFEELVKPLALKIAELYNIVVLGKWKI